MWHKLTGLFKTDQFSAEQQFLQDHQIEFDPLHGYIVQGVVLNDWSARLWYFSNRKLSKFDDLKALYFAAIVINEKIDLEIAHQRFVLHLGNTEENLLQLKQAIQKLNDYYRQFIRDQ